MIVISVIIALEFMGNARVVKMLAVGFQDAVYAIPVQTQIINVGHEKSREFYTKAIFYKDNSDQRCNGLCTCNCNLRNKCRCTSSREMLTYCHKFHSLE